MLFQVPGPCEVRWGATGSPTTWGTTKSGVIIRSTVSWVPIVIDESGGEPVDYIYGGRQMTVEIVGLDTTLITISRFKGNLLGDARGNVGEITGEGTTGKELWIVEKGGQIWKAKIAEPQDPSELLLRATTELDIPIVFLIAPDADDKLFYAVPTYLAAT